MASTRKATTAITAAAISSTRVSACEAGHRAGQCKTDDQRSDRHSKNDGTPYA